MVSELRTECPNSWKETALDLPGSEIWLNATIAYAECNVKENALQSAIPTPSPASSSSTISTSLISYWSVLGAGLFTSILVV